MQKSQIKDPGLKFSEDQDAFSSVIELITPLLDGVADTEDEVGTVLV